MKAADARLALKEANQRILTLEAERSVRTTMVASTDSLIPRTSLPDRPIVVNTSTTPKLPASMQLSLSGNSVVNDDAAACASVYYEKA
jgi:hypothetical protein